MRILQLCYEFPDVDDSAIVSGEVKNPYSLICALSQAGHDVTIINVPFMSRSIKRLRQRQWREHRVIDVPEGRMVAVVRYAWRSLNVSKGLRQLDPRDYDVIHAQAPALALGVVLRRLWSPAWRTLPLATTAHGTNLPEADADSHANFRQRLRAWNARLVLHVDRVAFRASDATITVSAFQEEELKEVYRLDPSTVVRIHNGVDIQRYKRPEGAAEHGTGILFVGRLTPKKGVQHLIRALARVVDVHPDVRLHVVGGSQPFDFYSKELKSLARSCGVENSIVWEMGVPEPDLPSRYWGARVAVFPSEGYESLPTVILEAMAAGVPVVATRAWGTPEALGQDHPWMLPEGNVDRLASAILEVLGGDTREDSVVADQLRRVGGFSIASTRDAHIKLYERLLETEVLSK